MQTRIPCGWFLGIAAATTLLGCLSATPPPIAPSDQAQPPHGTHDATARHSFENVEHWVSVFDDPARDEWQKPARVVEALQLRPGMCVADLGAGTGYFSAYLAAAVGEAGTVFAVDTEPALVAHLRERAEHERTPRVVPILASADNPRLPVGAVDVVLIVDTAHHLDDRINYLRRLRHVLKPRGRIVVIDFKKQEIPVGPPPEHKLAREQIVEEFGSAGYRLISEPDILPYQYFLIFQPS
ncbi:MAG: class I SAM-dependent methyltransferase [Candidatus Binatia bacterium]